MITHFKEKKETKFNQSVFKEISAHNLNNGECIRQIDLALMEVIDSINDTRRERGKYKVDVIVVFEPSKNDDNYIVTINRVISKPHFKASVDIVGSVVINDKGQTKITLVPKEQADQLNLFVDEEIINTELIMENK
jgi:hypothetical protein